MNKERWDYIKKLKPAAPRVVWPHGRTYMKPTTAMRKAALKTKAKQL